MTDLTQTGRALLIDLINNANNVFLEAGMFTYGQPVVVDPPAPRNTNITLTATAELPTWGAPKTFNYDRLSLPVLFENFDFSLPDSGGAFTTIEEFFSEVQTQTNVVLRTEDFLSLSLVPFEERVYPYVVSLVAHPNSTILTGTLSFTLTAPEDEEDEDMYYRAIPHTFQYFAPGNELEFLEFYDGSGCGLALPYVSSDPLNDNVYSLADLTGLTIVAAELFDVFDGDGLFEDRLDVGAVLVYSSANTRIFDVEKTKVADLSITLTGVSDPLTQLRLVPAAVTPLDSNNKYMVRVQATHPSLSRPIWFFYRFNVDI